MTRPVRDFHRIGVILALPELLLAVGLAGREEWLQWTARDPRASTPADALFDPPGYVADFTTSLKMLGVAVALYAGVRAFGWIVGRFGRL